MAKRVRDERGRFKKGDVGGPGRPPRAVELNFLNRIREKVGPELDAILDGLILIAKGKSTEGYRASVKASDRIRAAELLLAYGAGKPTQPIDLGVDLPEDVKEVIDYAD